MKYITQGWGQDKHTKTMKQYTKPKMS